MRYPLLPFMALFAFVVMCSGCSTTPPEIDIETYPFADPNFKRCVLSQGIYNPGAKTFSQIKMINCNKQQISNVAEIALMPALEELVLIDNQIAEIDTRHNPLLTRLVVVRNKLRSIDITHNPALTFFNVSGNPITRLNLDNNAQLRSVYAYNTALNALDLSEQTHMQRFGISGHKFKALDISQNTALLSLSASNGALQSVTLANHPTLTHLLLANNQLTGIDLTHFPALQEVSLRNNQLSALDLSHNRKLQRLEADYNQLTDIALPRQAELKGLVLNNNRLVKLDVSEFKALDTLVLFNNPLETLTFDDMSQIKTLSLEGTPIIKTLSQPEYRHLLPAQQNSVTPEVSVSEAGKIRKAGKIYRVISMPFVMPEVGQYMGFRYSVSLPHKVKNNFKEKAQTRFPIEVRMTHPPIVDAASGKTSRQSRWNDTMFLHDNNLAMWYFGSESEIVSGKWTLEIVYQDKVVASHAFMVANAEQDIQEMKDALTAEKKKLALMLGMGANALCEDDHFRRCLQFDKHSCQASLKTLQSQCVNTTLKAGKKSGTYTADKLVPLYLMCLTLKAAQQQGLGPEETGTCTSQSH